MAGSSFGTLFSLTTFGESHGPALGCILDGCPAGLPLSEEDIQPYLDRRKPGSTAAGTPRKEDDRVRILSGVFEGLSTGTPIAMVTENTAQRSGDYDRLRSIFRPGHGDYTYTEKYGLRDHRGGGRSSGRETAARVMGGAVAAKLLKKLGIVIEAYVTSIGDVCIDREKADMQLRLTLPTAMPDREADERAMALINEYRTAGDSLGSAVECVIRGVPAGLGDPVFDKLDATLSHAIMSIGAVKAVEIGDGIAVTRRKGSENNDGLGCDPDGKIVALSNHAGGILAGISSGQDILIKAHFKPTPSIRALQRTVDENGEPLELSIAGRHDPVIAPRACVVVECMAALTIADALLKASVCRLDRLEKLWK